MNHSFNTDYAELYGIEEAIILENIAFWIKKNESNNKNFYDGYTWTYNSADSFNKLFTYITPSKIRRCLLKLEELEVLKSGNYNKQGYDKTKWYSITNLEVSTFYKLKNGHYKMENGLYKLENRSEQIVEPIPDINTVINSNINKDIYTEIFNHYLSKENLTKHKNLVEPMKKGIALAIKTYDLDLDYLKKIIDRHSEKIEQTKNSEFPVSQRTLQELFGQKKYKSQDLICADYLDEKYISNKKLTVEEIKQQSDKESEEKYGF